MFALSSESLKKTVLYDDEMQYPMQHVNAATPKNLTKDKEKVHTPLPEAVHPPGLAIVTAPVHNTGTTVQIRVGKEGNRHGI